MARTLKVLAWLMGVSCLLIGVYHFALGVWSVPGAAVTDQVRATWDSRERTYSVYFAVFGLAWIWAARQTPIPARAVRILSLIFLASGLGRVLSVLVEGWPHPMQTGEAILELVLPFVFLALAGAAERADGAGGPRAHPARRREQSVG